MQLGYIGKKKSIYYHKTEEKKFATWFKESKGNVSRLFMIVADFSYKGKIKVKKLTKMSKPILNNTKSIF